MITITRLMTAVLILVASVPPTIGQNEEQVDEIERRGWSWSTTGRVASDAEVEAWMDRIDNLHWSDLGECAGTRAAVLGVYRGGDNLGWAEHRHGWSGVSTTGKHFIGWPFNNDHWIIVRPEGGGRTSANVLTTLIHEALHHVMGQAHTDEFRTRLDCATIDSGW